MKSVFITFDQAFYERILALLDRQNCRGFSYCIYNHRTTKTNQKYPSVNL